MENKLRAQHLKTFAKLSAAERIQWSCTSAWSTFNALPLDKQQIYLKMKRREMQQRNA